MKTVLLTGIGGSIGVHFVAHIMHNTDWNIVGVDSFRHKGEFDRITAVCEDHPDWPERIKVIQHDLTAPFTQRQTQSLGKIDYIIHLASLSDVQASIEDPVPTIKNNVELTLNTLELSKILKPKMFVLFSTDEVYGPAEVDGAHPEWDVILPSNPYAASKACQEAIAISYWRSYGVPLVITNTMNNFGEMQQPSKYPVKIQKAIDSGETLSVHSQDGNIGTRYYIHSRNAADAVLFILKLGKPTLFHAKDHIARPDRYNIVGDVQLDNLELAKLIEKLMGKKLHYQMTDFHSEQPGHDLHYGLNGDKLKKLGWKPPVDFKTSLKNTIEWQQQHSEWIR